MVTSRPRFAPPPTVTRRPSMAMRPNSSEVRRRTMPGHAFVADEDIRALAEDAGLDAFFVAGASRAINWSGFSGSAKNSAGPPN